MEAYPVELPNDPVLLKEKIHSLEVKNALLEERIRQLIQKRFSASSEKYSPDQVNLFDEAEQEQQEQEEDSNDQNPKDDEIAIPAHTRKKVGRKPLPDHLPRVREEHDIPEMLARSMPAATAKRVLRQPNCHPSQSHAASQHRVYWPTSSPASTSMVCHCIDWSNLP